MNSNEFSHLKCPDCKQENFLKYLWPSTQKPDCVEDNVMYFQRCAYCGWTGNVLTGERYEIERAGLAGYFINKRFFSSLEAWFKTLGLCE